MRILLIIGSTRRGRMTPRAAQFVTSNLAAMEHVETVVLDLAKLDIPIMAERLVNLEAPPPGIVTFADEVKKADAIVVAAPEYNGSYPGVLKNALDYLVKDYKGKKVAIVTVSAGPHGGDGCYAALKTYFEKMGAVVVARLKVTRVQDSLSETGEDVKGQYQEPLQEFFEALFL